MEMDVRLIDPVRGEAPGCHFASGRSTKPSVLVALLLDLLPVIATRETRMCSLRISGDTFPNTDQFPITYYNNTWDVAFSHDWPSIFTAVR
jgi:hypothetical protein